MQASALSLRMPVQTKLTNKDCLWLEEVTAGSPSAAHELMSLQTPERVGYVYTHMSPGSWRPKSVIFHPRLRRRALAWGASGAGQRGQQPWQ